MSFLTSTGKEEEEEEEPICVDYGADSDEDSEVIVIDTTPTILAQKISADSDCLPDAQKETHGPAKKRRIEGTTENAFLEASLHATTANEDNDPNGSEARTNEDLNLKDYASIFEGCNSQEPIEIDGDSDDENDCNIEDGKMRIDSSPDSATSFTTSTTETNPSVPEPKESTSDNEQKNCNPRLDHANQISSEKLTDEREKENAAATNSTSGAACSRDSNISDAIHSTTDWNLEVDALKGHVTQTMEADSDETANPSRDVKEDTRKRPKPSIEVIDLADDDDDDSICQEQHSNGCNTTKSRDTSKVQEPEIEIIDVDELDDIDSEARHDKRFRQEGDVEERNTTMKPRFKPNKNNKPRKGEMFESLLRRHKEDLRYRAMQTNAARSNRDGSSWQRPKPPSFTEKRFVFHPSNRKPGDHNTNLFLGMDIEDARKEQDRLLRQAANRVRNQPSFHVANEEPSKSTKAAQAFAFSKVVADVHIQYPNHFQYRDCYARLGLPRNANESTIKSQYKRLARVYHPDRNIGKADTKHKFQAVTEAYNQLLQPSK